MRRALTWAGPGLLLVEFGLVLTGRLSVGTALVVVAVLEAALTVAAIGQLAAGVRRYRRQRADGTDRDQALQDALLVAVPAPVAFVVRQELLTWSCLALLLRRRRHGVNGNAVALPYDGPLRPLGLVLVGLSVVELVVFEMVVPWPSVRLVLLVLGIWTLLFVLGAAAGTIVRPHLVTYDELHLRCGTWADARIPLSRVAAARVRLRSAPSSKALVLHDGELVMAISGTTNVDVDLVEATTLRTSQGASTVCTVRFAADDPAAAVRALQKQAGFRGRDRSADRWATGADG